MNVYFAGGGTGGHLYPAIAVAQQLETVCPQAESAFFCSGRAVDARVLSPTGYEFFPMPAQGLSFSPKGLIHFYGGFIKSYYFAKQILSAHRKGAVVVGTGGFVCAPVVLAARSLKIPVLLINVDIVPGKANRFIARFSKKVFVQFDKTSGYFKAGLAEVVGCPLRAGFQNADPQEARQALKLDPVKKTLLITGASSGSQDINRAILKMLPHIGKFAAGWQIVHLTGTANYSGVVSQVKDSPVAYFPVEYYDNMPSLYAAADIIIGRAGAVSVAEYAAAGRPSICIPYPYHRDNHQYLNAEQLSLKNAAVIVPQNLSNPMEFESRLMKTAFTLMDDDHKQKQMRQAAAACARTDAAGRIARAIADAAF